MHPEVCNDEFPQGRRNSRGLGALIALNISREPIARINEIDAPVRYLALKFPDIDVFTMARGFVKNAVKPHAKPRGVSTRNDGRVHARTGMISWQICLLIQERHNNV